MLLSRIKAMAGSKFRTRTPYTRKKSLELCPRTTISSRIMSFLSTGDEGARHLHYKNLKDTKEEKTNPGLLNTNKRTLIFVTVVTFLLLLLCYFCSFFTFVTFVTFLLLLFFTLFLFYFFTIFLFYFVTFLLYFFFTFVIFYFFTLFLFYFCYFLLYFFFTFVIFYEGRQASWRRLSNLFAGKNGFPGQVR